VDPKVKSICSIEGPEFWYVYIRVRGHWRQRRLMVSGAHGSHVDPKVKRICSIEGPEFWYDYIRVSWTWATVTIDGVRSPRIPCGS
jgi:hypothetical protein